ncbi:hypothetical protein LTS08_005316 [Lithohypha guttulata]|uniref:uncharacterized protein n=1 Tax=Lithohypha guttulata TaxID=1690604 RepID=UPI002DDE4F86|nr:hypothetical protein LTR51_004950 [Lithohypha guttulata]KAK5100565.1 hypothetical protein LTS08_005316 [Lithohypha guttulata]
MAQESIYADGEELKAIRSTAKRLGVMVNMGFSEKSRHSTATMYNSNVLIGDDGTVLLTWSPGDGAGLRVAQTKFGNIGALICGENTNPLARYALMTQAEQVHISTWPGIWPTRLQENVAQSYNPESMKAPVNYNNVAANRIRAAAHCFEAKCFGIVSAGLVDDACKEVIASHTSQATTIKAQLDAAPQAASMFLDPTGALLPGFTIDESTGSKQTRDFLQKEPDILYADLDLNQCVEGKQYHDVTGGYQRLDVFDLKIDRTRRDPATFID